MKPDWCSQDIWDSAFYHMDDFALVGSCADDDESSVQQAIARAIMAERETCARVADKTMNPGPLDAASAIRNRP